MGGKRNVPASIHALEKGKFYGELRDRVENEPQQIVRYCV
jgi:hypothetical protein